MDPQRFATIINTVKIAKYMDFPEVPMGGIEVYL